MKATKRNVLFVLVFLLSSTLLFANSSREIIADSNEALEIFQKEIPHAKQLLDKSKGYVIFPDINEASFFLGGKYGEGVLIVDDKIKSFHSLTSASIGLQMGMQNYSLIIVFTSDKALNSFLHDNDDDWETDTDDKIKIVMADWTSGDDVDKVDYGTSMIGFAFDNTGMIGKFSYQGTKFETINPDD